MLPSRQDDGNIRAPALACVVACGVVVVCVERVCWSPPRQEHTSRRHRPPSHVGTPALSRSVPPLDFDAFPLCPSPKEKKLSLSRKLLQRRVGYPSSPPKIMHCQPDHPSSPPSPSSSSSLLGSRSWLSRRTRRPSAVSSRTCPCLWGVLPSLLDTRDCGPAGTHQPIVERHPMHPLENPCFSRSVLAM